MAERYFRTPYQFIPPYRSVAWCRLLAPLIPWRLRREVAVERVTFVGLDHLRASLRANAGVMLAPNHCRWADPLVMGRLTQELGQYFYYAASYHLFKQNRWRGWLLNRLGAFSIWREGTDREALRAATQILTQAERPLVIFPEGTWFRQNDVVGPLQDGVAFMARQALKSAKRPIVIHPVALKYWTLADPQPGMEQRLSQWERYFGMRAPPGPLLERIGRLGSGLLALKEVEYCGHAQAGDLDERIAALGATIVTQAERRHLGRGFDDWLLARIRRLRLHLVSQLQAPDCPEELAVRRTLDDLLFVENLRAHSWRYVSERPTPERLLETVQRIEETLTDRFETRIVPLGVVVAIGEPLQVAEFAPRRSERSAGDPLLTELARRMQQLLDERNRAGPPSAWRWARMSVGRIH